VYVCVSVCVCVGGWCVCMYVCVYLVVGDHALATFPSVMNDAAVMVRPRERVCVCVCVGVCI
jgi:hypothetical protein